MAHSGTGPPARSALFSITTPAPASRASNSGMYRLIGNTSRASWLFGMTSASCAAASASTASQSIRSSYMPKASEATRRPASKKATAIVELFTRLFVPKTPTLVGPGATGGTTDGSSENSQWVFSRQEARSNPVAGHAPEGPCHAISEAQATCASVAEPITAAAARAGRRGGTARKAPPTPNATTAERQMMDMPR